jgi:hypothetical protein
MVAELWQRVLPVLLEALSAEMDLSTIITKIECLRECLEVSFVPVNILFLLLFVHFFVVFKVLGKGSLNGEQLQNCLTVFMSCTLNCLKHKFQLSVRENEEDFDDVEKTLVDSEQSINEGLVHSILILCDVFFFFLKIPLLRSHSDVFG